VGTLRHALPHAAASCRVTTFLSLQKLKRQASVNKVIKENLARIALMQIFFISCGKKNYTTDTRGFPSPWSNGFALGWHVFSCHLKQLVYIIIFTDIKTPAMADPKHLNRQTMCIL
jgi:hypothetical protein